MDITIVEKRTHELQIQTELSNCVNTKSFSFKSEECPVKILKYFKDIIEKGLKTNIKPNMIIIDEKVIHRFLLMDFNTKKSKSFIIDIPHLSNCDLIKYLKGEIKDGN